MATIRKIKKSSKQEVIVEETVTDSIAPNKHFKRDLQLLEPVTQEFHKLFTCVVTQASDPAQDAPNAQKLFLHKSVSKYKPDNELLKKWMHKLYKAPVMFLASTGCAITLIQPQTKRPSRTFVNPHKPRGKHVYNDGATYAQIVLLHFELYPQQEQDEASHICGHKRCVNPAHLLWESSSDNFTRNECHHYNKQCTHNPRCLPCSNDDLIRVQHQLQIEIDKKRMKKAALTKYFCKNKG